MNLTVIIIFVMVFAFLAVRLYAVLGKRTGHEQTPMPRLAEERAGTESATPRTAIDPQGDIANPTDALVTADAQTGLRALIAADRSFEPARFMSGAQAAYGMILSAFWRGDRDELASLCDADVLASFVGAIDEREEAGHVLDNRLVRIDRARIENVLVADGMAHVTVRFEADIAAVTRDKDGTVIAGSLADAVSTNDVWTFSRTLRSADPNWTLTDTDEA